MSISSIEVLALALFGMFAFYLFFLAVREG